MTFESVSKSPWILPATAWIAAPIVLAIALRRRDFFRIWGLAFGALIALDAWLNGSLSPLEGAWATAAGVTFVILGDLRLFLAVEWDGTRTSIARAVALAWIVPLSSQLARATVPAVTRAPRVTFLVYELLFLLLLGGWFLLRVRRLPAERRDFAARLVRFFGVQYALWASADIVLLMTGSDIGFGVRLVPDMLYYVVFVPWVLAIAPDERERTPT